MSNDDIIHSPRDDFENGNKDYQLDEVSSDFSSPAKRPKPHKDKNEKRRKKEKKAEKTKYKSAADEYESMDDVPEIDTLKTFTIPKRKKAKRELFEYITHDSRDFVRDVLPVLHTSLKDRSTSHYFEYSNIALVHNDDKILDYQERRKQWRQSGYSDKEISDSYAFVRSVTKLSVHVSQKNRHISFEKQYFTTNRIGIVSRFSWLLIFFLIGYDAFS